MKNLPDMILTSTRFCIFLAIALILFTGCNSDKKSDTLFKHLAASKTGIKFVNKVENTERMNIFSYRNFYNGGGVGLAISLRLAKHAGGNLELVRSDAGGTEFRLSVPGTFA